VVGQGYTVSINIMVFNYGNDTETFDVTLYANTTEIETWEITLSSENSTTITFTWNTSGFARAYVISANVTILPDETDTADNTFIYGIVKVSCLGDLNGDYTTDGQDYQLVKIAIPSIPNSSQERNADLNDDGVIDGQDFQIVKIHIPSALP
jgi:uncharacterized protein (DUF736 family)